MRINLIAGVAVAICSFLGAPKASAQNIVPMTTDLREQFLATARQCQQQNAAVPDKAAACFGAWYSKNYSQGWAYGFPILADSHPISATLRTPLIAAATLVTNALQTAEPVQLPSAESLDVVTVEIQPRMVTSPNVARVLLAKSASESVQPLSTLLQPREFKNRLGGSFTKSSGIVSFPRGAFDGKPMTLTFITDSGNVTAELRVSDLNELK